MTCVSTLTFASLKTHVQQRVRLRILHSAMYGIIILWHAPRCLCTVHQILLSRGLGAADSQVTMQLCNYQQQCDQQSVAMSIMP